MTMTTVRLGSSLRCRAPEETLAAAQVLMTPLGISRVADITRMDCLGLPVFASIRPRGHVLQVHAGKGLVPIDAQVGALMEAIEFAVAEPGRTPWAAQPMAVGRWLSQFEGRIDLLDFAPEINRPITLDDVLVTVPCEQIGAARTVQLPAELIFVPFEHAGTSAPFGWSTTGLASGNSVDEASLHALLEVLERDTLTMNRALDRSCWVEQCTLPATLVDLLADWQQLGIETAVRWLPNPFGITCFRACIHEPTRSSVHLTWGAGAHPDPVIAVTRALCEAAQSRLSFVHGGREDIVGFYARYAGLNGAARDDKDCAALGRIFDRTRTVAFADLPVVEPVGNRTPGQLLDRLLATMAAAGFDCVFRYRFAMDLGPLEVVKVVVPRCEDAEISPSRMGRRLFGSVTGAPLP